MIVTPLSIRSNRRTLRVRARGITLIETLAVMAIAAVLAMVALPGFAQMMDRQRATLAANDLVLAANLARSTAAGTQSRVAVAPLADGAWESGWRVFFDRNDNGVFDDGDEALREFTAAGVESVTAHFGAGHFTALSFDLLGNPRRPGSNGLLLGRIVIRQHGEVRAVCVSALQVRMVAAAQCGQA